MNQDNGRKEKETAGGDPYTPVVVTNGYPDPYWTVGGGAESKFSFPNPITAPPKQMGSRKKSSDLNQPPKYQDLWAAVVFLGHLVALLYLAFGKGLPLLRYDISNKQNTATEGPASDVNIKSDSLVKLVAGGLVSTLLAGVFSLLSLRLLINNSESAIKVVLFISIFFQAASALTAFFTGAMWLGVMCLVFLAITCCFFYMVRNRIPFAAANLSVACQAIRASSGVVLVSFLCIFMQAAWQFVWSLAFIGSVMPRGGYQITQGGYLYSPSECHSMTSSTQGDVCRCESVDHPVTFSQGACHVPSPPAGIIFLLLVSFFWTSCVVQYVSVCTTAGVVGEWWFSGTSKGATTGSLKRATTTSFGSICFGSLIIAVIRAVHQMLQEIRKQENSTIAACAECLLGLVDTIATYINRYAMVYVALYGSSLMQSGRSVIDMFKQRGLTAIINDQLISNVLTLAMFTCGVVVGLLSYMFAWVIDVDKTYTFLLVGIGFLLGLMVNSTVMGVVDSATATVFVCFAESPDALQRNHQPLYARMAEAWDRAQQQQ